MSAKVGIVDIGLNKTNIKKADFFNKVENWSLFPVATSTFPLKILIINSSFNFLTKAPIT